MKTDLMMQAAEREARDLRSQYLNDRLVRAVIAFDLAIRRAACRVLAWQ
jgi:hypothetical protein